MANSSNPKSKYLYVDVGLHTNLKMFLEIANSSNPTSTYKYLEASI